MNLTTTKTLFLIVLVTVAFSCKKSNSTPSKSKTELLTQAAWKYQSSGYDGDKNGTIDAPDSPDACETDNVYTFQTNGNGVMDEGATICTNGDPQTQAFTWSFGTGETAITITGGTGNSLDGTANIQTLNDTNLTVYQDVNVLGTVVRYVIILKH